MPSLLETRNESYHEALRKRFWFVSRARRGRQLTRRLGGRQLRPRERLSTVLRLGSSTLGARRFPTDLWRDKVRTLEFPIAAHQALLSLLIF
ncbi:hypothetical protein NDU88_001265 [Pleurodeles waltl]|uniref:Uncharacterized protein n=1 Tax=Pleurodeles waltl TaxID=8319 RepID=A0AAV7ML11_PLEWA|nr:hypothetical protein NDU88_001265 [Pleurodeles waltl]